MPFSKNDLNHSIPDLTGKTALVTGGNKGLGYESVLQMADKGAKVILACRDVKQGQAAKASIMAQVPQAAIEVMALNLTHAQSIKSFCDSFKQKHESLDILLLNAGVVNLEQHQLTHSGQEMHMATNHLGHFALTGQLFDVLLNSKKPRVVTVSSLAYKAGVINFEDFNWHNRSYDRFKAYGDSKLANLLFMMGLQKRFDKAGVNGISLSAHPGLTATERQQTIGIGGALAHWIASPVKKGSRSQLLAATGAGVKANQFYGPKFALLGKPKALTLKSKFLNEAMANKLWEYSEAETGVSFSGG